MHQVALDSRDSSGVKAARELDRLDAPPGCQSGGVEDWALALRRAVLSIRLLWPSRLD